MGLMDLELEILRSHTKLTEFKERSNFDLKQVSLSIFQARGTYVRIPLASGL
jgi:hypothetical protein